MILLTLSDQQSDDLVGVFPDLKAVRDAIIDEYGDPHDDDDFEDCGDFTDLQPYDDSKDEDYDKKPGLRRTHRSAGFIDNGYGGRYYSVWEIVQ